MTFDGQFSSSIDCSSFDSSFLFQEYYISWIYIIGEKADAMPKTRFAFVSFILMLRYIELYFNSFSRKVEIEMSL